MRKFYSLVLIAAGLLIGTNAWATWETVYDADEFGEIWAELSADNPLQIKLGGNISLSTTQWIGTANMTDDPLSVEIDLNGHDLTLTAERGFILTHGVLKFINSNPGEDEDEIAGKVEHTGDREAIYVTGSTQKDVDPSVDGANYFSHLIIGKNVVITKSAGYDAAIVIDDIYKGSPAAKMGVNYYTNVYATSASTQNKGVANGVRIDIYGQINGTKYGVKTNGYLGNVKYFLEPAPAGRGGNIGDAPQYTTDSKIDPTYRIQANDDNYAPFIHIYPGTKIILPASSSKDKKPAGIYAGGFARWLVEGYVQGATGAVVKSGDIVINNAEIKGTGEYAQATHTTSGNTASGSAILIVTDASWVGDMNVTVSGTTVASSTNGYALEEDVKIENTEVETINILGGTFEGSKDLGTDPVTGNPIVGAISISETTKKANESTTEPTTVNVISATISGETKVGTDGNLDDIIGEGRTDIEIGKDEQGKTTVLVTVPTPDAAASDFDIDNANGTDVNLSAATLANKNQVFDSESISVLNLGQLVMTNPSDVVTLTIKTGHTIIADNVTLGSKAQIIVEPGAALIVKGEEGIVSTKASNLVLKANATDQATFLLNPTVTKNAEPLATVQLYTVGKQIYRNPWYYQFHRFALPIKESVKPTNDYAAGAAGLFEGETEFYSNIRGMIYEQNEWNYLSSWSSLKPFVSYQLANSSKDGGVTYTFEGHLHGNKNRECSFPVQGFGYFGNSHLAPIDVAKLMEGFGADVQQSVWIYDYDAHSFETLTPRTLGIFAATTAIKSMQGFVLYGKVEGDVVAPINYANAVYTPAYSAATANQAPVRNRESSLSNGALIKVIAENGMADQVILMEEEAYSNQFDNGADASKLMNEDGINLYVATINGDQSIVADNNIENTLLSFKAGEATNYTLQFGKVFGEDYAIRDNVTGAVFNCAEGETYTFTQAANTTVSGRFEVVGVAKMPTAIENTEAVKSAKGIYSITGQYLGENFEILPAGVYVVNGVKVVK